jgi:thioesterase domain-containing protein
MRSSAAHALQLAAAALAGAAALLLTQRHGWRLSRPAAAALPGSAWLHRALRRTIPLTRHMAVRVLGGGERDAQPLLLGAPLPPNANIHGSAFAGSLHSVAVLAGWGWLALHARRTGGALGDATVVVRATQMAYRAPVTSAFVAHAEPPSAAELARCALRCAAERAACARDAAACVHAPWWALVRRCMTYLLFACARLRCHACADAARLRARAASTRRLTRRGRRR